LQVGFFEEIFLLELHQYFAGLLVGQSHRGVQRLDARHRGHQRLYQLDADAPGEPQAQLLLLDGFDPHQQAVFTFVILDVELVDVHCLDFRQARGSALA